MRWLLAFVVATLCGCGASDRRDVITARHVDENSGAPDVTRITDLGDLTAIPARGAIPVGASDGIFVIGELILIEGDDFGKLPTIAIGGRPAANLARTRSGGIVSRIPQEVPDGVIPVEVSHPDGRDSKEIELSRYLALAGPKSVHLMATGARPTLKHRFEVAGATGLAFSHDGQALYIAGPRRRSLQIVKVAAKGRPATSDRIEVGEQAVNRLVTRMGVPILAALGKDGVRLFDTRVPTAISEGPMIAIADGASAGAFSPDGQFLAVIGSANNRVTLIRLATSAAPTPSVAAELELMAGDTVPLLRDLAFAPEGDELWVISGNTELSTVAGVRPTRVTRLALNDGVLSELATATVAKAAGPRYIAVSQRQAIMAAAAVRSTKQRAAMVLSTVPASLVGVDTGSKGSKCQILRFDLEGNASVLVDGPGIYSRSLLSHDQRWVYAATRQDGRIGVTSVALDGGEPIFLELADDEDVDELQALPLAIAP